MDEFLDSAGIVMDGDALAARLREDGSDVEAAIADPAQACVDPEAPFVAVLRRFYRDAAGHALKLHPNVIGLFERLFGEPVLAHPLLIPRCIFPQRPEFTTPSHQDFPHIQGTTETLSLWLPLGDCQAEIGGPCVRPAPRTEGR